MQPLDLVVLAIAGAAGALATVLVLKASFVLVLPIAVLVAGIGYAIAQQADDGEEDQHLVGRGFDDALGGH
jgi:membrane protein implicated in regulation of membrane protease activity